MKVFSRIMIILLCTLGVIVISSGIYYFSVTAGVNLDQNKLISASDCISVYDDENELISEINKIGNNSIKYEELSPYTLKAFVAAEDKNFYSHHGFDWKRIIKASWINLKSREFKQGASTISQQLIKNTQLSEEKTISRKLKEFKMTRQLEKKYTKEEILEMYVNTIYFGHSAFGLQNASRLYFGKDANNLSIGESAELAGIIKSPNRYSPIKNPKICRERRNNVLNSMLSLNFINEKELEIAKNEDIKNDSIELSGEESYLSIVYNEIEDKLSDNVYGGIKVYTYFNKKMQEELKNQSKYCDSNHIFCVLDNTTHSIIAYYSTVGTIKRLPASIIKPLAVYGPAIEENIISPATSILDEKVSFGGYSPQNYDKKYHGYISARDALSESLNIPAVKILNTLTPEKASKYLEKMQLNIDDDEKNLSLALGGMKEGFSLLQLAKAYSTFSDEGYYTPCDCVKEIKKEKGTVLYSKQFLKTRVFTNETTTLLNDILMTTCQKGTAKKLKNLPYEICAKTGTCGNSNGNTDAYTISYTKNHTVGVWLGNADNSFIDYTGGGIPCYITKNINEFVYQNNLPSPFIKSEKVKEYNLDKKEYEENHALIQADCNAPIISIKTELFSENSAPTKISTFFSNPNAGNVKILYKNSAVCIVLCVTEYYDYLINRTENGKTITIYQGKAIKEIFDSSVKPGKNYSYTVTPYYKSNVGETILLPQIIVKENGQIEKKENQQYSDKNILKNKNDILNKNWWNE